MAKNEKRRIGDMGEEVACTFLKKQGFKLIERNYWKRCGEIDIVASKEGRLHFVEVKSITRAIVSKKSIPVTRETRREDNKRNQPVSYETEYRPEENMHPGKIQRLARVIEVYLSEKDVSHETEWQLDLVVVRLNMNTRRASVSVIENVF